MVMLAEKYRGSREFGKNRRIAHSSWPAASHNEQRSSTNDQHEGTRPPTDPVSAKVWYYLWQEEVGSPISLREILNTTKPPADPIKAEIWKYWRAIIYSIACAPFFAMLAYASSAAAPGFRPLRRVGFLKWFERFFILNSRLNICGVLSIIFVAATFVVLYVHNRRGRRSIGKGS